MSGDEQNDRLWRVREHLSCRAGFAVVEDRLGDDGVNHYRVRAEAKAEWISEAREIAELLLLAIDRSAL